MEFIKKIKKYKELILGLFLILIIVLNIVSCCKPFYNGWYYGKRNGVKVELNFNENTFVGNIFVEQEDSGTLTRYLCGNWEQKEDFFVLNNITASNITFERCSVFLLQGKFMSGEVISVYCPMATFLQVLYGVIYVLYVIIFIIYFAKIYENKLTNKTIG